MTINTSTGNVCPKKLNSDKKISFYAGDIDQLNNDITSNEQINSISFPEDAIIINPSIDADLLDDPLLLISDRSTCMCSLLEVALANPIKQSVITEVYGQLQGNLYTADLFLKRYLEAEDYSTVKKLIGNGVNLCADVICDYAEIDAPAIEGAALRQLRHLTKKLADLFTALRVVTRYLGTSEG